MLKIVDRKLHLSISSAVHKFKFTVTHTYGFVNTNDETRKLAWVKDQHLNQSMFT